MKKTALLILLAWISMHTAFAQMSVKVEERVHAMSLGERTGYTIVLNGMSEKDVAKAFRSWAEDLQKKADVDESGKHELRISGFTGGHFSEQPVNVYVLFEEGKQDIRMTGFFEWNGTFISSATAPEKTEHCKQLMTRFAYRIEKIKIEEQLAAAGKDLEKRQSEQQSLEKKQKQLNDQITECEETISKAKSDLEVNATDQKNKKEEIGKQEATVKEIEKKLKEYEEW